MNTASDDRAVLVGSLMAALIFGQQAAAKVVRGALFLSAYPATLLPLAIIAASSVCLIGEWALTAVAPVPAGVLYGSVVALCAAVLFLTPRLHHGYVATLEQNLRAGRVTIAEPDVLDEATRSALKRVSPRLDGSANHPAADASQAADPTMEAIVALRSEDPERILRALSTGGSSNALVGHMIPLLERDDVHTHVVAALRSARPAPIGQLVDALLDASRKPVGRLRVARVLRGLPHPRTAEGLLLGLRDVRRDVRAHCGRALEVLARRDPSLRPAAEQVFGAVDVELANSARDVDLDHVFTLIALALGRQSVRLALEALRGPEPGDRGAALEYLANVLPPRVRDSLWPRLTNLGETRRRVPEVATEASSSAVPINGAAFRVQLLAAADGAQR